MKAVTAEQMQSLDRRTIEETGVLGIELMERAGRSIAVELKQILADLASPSPYVLFLAGKGNNGGDAWVAARHLKQVGLHCEVWLAGLTSDLQGDARQAFDRADAAAVSWRQLAKEEDWTEGAIDWPLADVVVDGLLGTGSQGAPRGVIAAAVEAMNRNEAGSYRVALDLPSGLDANMGFAEGLGVQADLTLTLGAAKIGLLQPPAWELTGSQRVLPIGLPKSYFDDLALQGPEVIQAPRLARRSAASHKGNYGRVACLGGAAGYAGAIALAGEAALRMGSGLVTVFTEAETAATVAGFSRELMVRGDLHESIQLQGTRRSGS